MSDIFTSLLTWVSSGTDKLTDFNVGSAIRTLLESIALQLEEFYFDLQQAVRYAIENAIYNAFGFEKKAATKSSGYVTVTFKAALSDRMLITKGTIFTTYTTSSHTLQFEATEDVFAAIGSIEVMVPVQCTIYGSLGNISAYEITTLAVSNMYVDFVTNLTSFINGQDEETTAQRKLRFKEYIRSLQRGTAESIAYGAKTVTGVAGVWVDDSYIGFVRVYVHDHNGELSPELKNAVLDTLDNYRAAGIEVSVIPVVKIEVDINITIVFKEGVSIAVYTGSIQELITNFIDNNGVSNSLYMADIIAVIMNNYSDVIVTVSIIQGEDIHLQNNEMVSSGVVSVSGVYLSDWRR